MKATGPGGTSDAFGRVKVRRAGKVVAPREKPRFRRYRWLSRRQRRDTLIALACLTPWIVGFLVFTLYALGASLYYSLTDYPILGSPAFVGLQNFITLFQDRLFWTSLRVTSIYTFVGVPAAIIIGFAMASLLNQKIRGLAIWRTIFYLPSIVPAVAAAYIWSWIFEPEFGLLDALLRVFHMSGPDWLASTTWVLPAFIIMYLWGAGGNLLLYLAALNQVPTELYEAARVDGARGWGRLWHVTLPMCSPVILFTFLTGIIGTLQVFTNAYVLTNGGPNNASLFYVLYLYQNGWQYFKMGYASALAWVLFLLMLALTVITLRVSRRLVYYEV